MTVKTGQAWAGLFVTLDATGAASAADSTPTGTLYVDGVSDAATVTITGSNPYKFAVTLPTLTAGQRVDMYITATIDTIATAGIVASAQADTVLLSDGVTLASSQPAITWGQQKIIADADGEGALDIVNIGTGGGGVGIHTEGQFAGQFNEGAGGSSSGTFNIGVDYGLQNQGGFTGQRNYGGDLGVHNEGGYLGVVNEGGNSGVVNYGGDSGVRNEGDVQAVDGYDPALATASDLTTVDGKVDAIKLKTDNLPADPAAVGSAMTLTAAYDKAKDDVLTPLAAVDSIVDAIKAQTDKIPASPASAGEYTANIGAIKAKTDNLPLSPASSGEYTSALTAIQNDLDNPDQYKADISTLATTAHVQEVEDKVDIVDGIADAILDDTGTTGVLLSTSALGSIFDDEVIVGTYTFSDLLKIMAAALAGKLSGGGTTTLTFRGVDDASDVIVTTVDANKNRTNVVITV